MHDATLGSASVQFDAHPQDVLGIEDFSELLVRTGAMVEAHNRLHQRTHDSLNSLLAVAHRIGQRVKDDDASFRTFASVDFWRSRKPRRKPPMLAAVQFVLRPETTSERKMAAKYASALREFAERGVTPEHLAEAIRQSRGGLSEAARQCSARRRPNVPRPSADPSVEPPVLPAQPAPQGSAQADDQLRGTVTELDRARGATQRGEWKLAVLPGLKAKLTTWRKAGVATFFDGRFRLREGGIELIAAGPARLFGGNVRPVAVRPTGSGGRPLSCQNPAAAPKSAPK